MSAGTEAQLTSSMLFINLLITAVTSLVSFVVTNMGVLISVHFYYDYRFRKEGLGLHLQQLAAQRGSQSNTDRFDTSGQHRPVPMMTPTTSSLAVMPAQPPSGPASLAAPWRLSTATVPFGPAIPSGPPQLPPNPSAFMMSIPWTPDDDHARRLLDERIESYDVEPAARSWWEHILAWLNDALRLNVDPSGAGSIVIQVILVLAVAVLIFLLIRFSSLRLPGNQPSSTPAG